MPARSPSTTTGDGPLPAHESSCPLTQQQNLDRFPSEVMRIPQELVSPSPTGDPQAHPTMTIVASPLGQEPWITPEQHVHAHALLDHILQQRFGSADGMAGSLPAPFDMPHSRSSDDGYSDSAYDSDSVLGDDTFTLASHYTNYRYENGRRYHAYKDGAYWGPNDDQANENQNQTHEMYRITLDGRLHLAPIDTNPQRILDVGTGTGSWAIDMADEHRSASVIGTDLSPIQPEFIPPNCSFEIDDMTAEWLYPADHFDFVHVRELFGCVPDWDAFLGQAYKVTRPGGWVEVVEPSTRPLGADGALGPEHFYNTWGDTVAEMGERSGKSFAVWDRMKANLERAGFVDVREVRFAWPINGWSEDPKLRELGERNRWRLHNGVEDLMLRLLTATGGWSPERAQEFLERMRQQLGDTGVRAYIPGSVVYGRKPALA